MGELAVLITNGTLITMRDGARIIADGALRFVGDTIAEVGTSSELTERYPDEEKLDASGMLVAPGNICAHTHFYGAFARGMGIPGQSPEDFPQILERLWWRLDKALTLEQVRYSALVCLVDAIRGGTTTLIDHHASPSAIDGSLDVIAGAVREAGLRACLCYEVSDRDGLEVARAGIEENARFIGLAPEWGGLLAATFGLHASLTLSDKTLDEAVAVARSLDTGCHIHVAEGVADVQDCLRKHGVRVVERLRRRGVLGPKTIAAHCVHVDDSEMDTLLESGTKVVHNPRSNMNNAVGVARVPEMLARGIPVGLGNDGFSNNMYAEMKAAYLVHKLAKKDPRVMGAADVLEMASTNNARIAGCLFARPLGVLAPGAYADIVLLDYLAPTPLTEQNYPWHVVFGIDGAHVDTTIVAGKVLMRGRRLLTLNADAIYAEARQQASQLWETIRASA
jgi:putative selenium metabolism protein SsnA